MRQSIRSLLLLFLAVLTAFSMTACDSETPEQAYYPETISELWEKIDGAMNAVSSMEITITTDRVYYYMGNRYEHTGTNYILSAKNAHYTESETTISCEALALSQTVRLVEAYYEGVMYRSVNNGTYDQKFSSPITHDEYDQLQSGDPTGQIPLIGCTDASFSGSEAEGWELHFSGYTKKTIDNTVTNLGLTEAALGGVIEDMQVTLQADTNFRVKSMEVDFLFAATEGEAKPSFTVRTAYAGYNEAAFDPAKLNVEEYVPVEDIRILDQISAAMKARQEAQIGQFVLTTSTKEEYQGQVRTAQEKGTMVYGWKNGAYAYFFTANTEGQSFVVRYYGNEQQVISGGNSYTVAMTDGEAKAYIDGLIDSAKYDPLAISGIEKLEEGVYLLTTDTPQVSDYTDALEITEAHQTIKVTFVDGKLNEIDSELTINGTYNEETIALTTESLITFTPVTSDSLL